MLTKLPKIPKGVPIAIDLETCDPELKFTAPGYISKVGFVAGIAIGTEEESHYLPIGHTDGDNYKKETVLNFLDDYLRDTTTEKIFHNAQYDLGWLRYIGCTVRGRLFDTMLAAPLLNENRRTYTLDSLGKEYANEGKYEEALKLAVADKYASTKTRKQIIRLKDTYYGYKPFMESKTRVCQYYDLMPDEVKNRYDLVGCKESDKGQVLYKLPTKSASAYKGLLWSIDPEEMGSYPMQDVALTYKLYTIFKEQLKEQNLLKLAELENELVPVLLEMRETGVRIDIKKVIDLDKKYTKDLDLLQKKVDKEVGRPISVNVDDDLISICKDLNLEYAVTEKGNPSFTKENIPKDDKGIFENILKIRELNKARDTYVRGYFFGHTLEGRLHGQYNQLKSDEGGTVTGRLSSSNPNMQNLPNPRDGYNQIGVDIRGAFIPDTEEEEWLCLDYSGQEPKMLVHTVINVEDAYGRLVTKTNGEIGSQCIRLLEGSDLARTEAFRGRKADFHTSVAKICMAKEYQMCGKEPEGDEFAVAVKSFRPKAKSIGLGVMYGSGNEKVAAEMTKKGFPMTTLEAANIRTSIYTGVPFLKSISDLLMNKAKTRGFILTVLGRRGRFDMWECPVFNKEEKKKIGDTLFQTQEEALAFYKENRSKYQHLGKPQRAFAYKALNKLIQGSSADQTKLAMVALYKRNKLELSSLDIYFRLIDGFTPPKLRIQVHDEINVSIHPANELDKPEWFQEVMETCLPLKVEAVADPHVGRNWGEAK